jgi:hypothetical protein
MEYIACMLKLLIISGLAILILLFGCSKEELNPQAPQDDTGNDSDTVIFNYQTDSMAVRAILDSNGLYNIPVDSVIMKSSSDRIVFLDLDGFTSEKNLPQSITVLPDDIGNITMLHELLIISDTLESLPDAMGNLKNLTKIIVGTNLKSLPETIGNITYLTELYLAGNQLQELPESIGNLSYLKLLDLRFNQLTDLPDSIIKLTGLQELLLDNNKLCSLSAEVKAWADTYSPGWDTTQDCSHLIKSETIGSWQGQMDLRPFGWDVNMTIYLDINDADSTYIYNTINESNGILDTIYWHEGTWNSNDSIITLNCENCKKDSSGHLMPHYCGYPLLLYINIFLDDESKTVWDIPIGDLEEAVMALGIMTQAEFDQLKVLPFRMKKI